MTTHLYAEAGMILGSDFITPQDVMKTGIVYTDEQISALVATLPSAGVLGWCRKNGYAMMPYPPRPMSLLDVRELNSRNFFLKSGGWYANQKESFSQTVMPSSGWLMIRKMPVPDSILRNWEEQKTLLSALERVPSAVEMAWFITTYFEVRGVRLFKDMCVRTSSLGLGCSRVYVGYFKAEGLYLTGIFYNYRFADIGLASARR